MTMRYTNKNNIPLALAVMLATDYYDHSDDPKTIGVTTLLGSTRSVILSNRITEEEACTDVSDVIASRLGTALHDALEKAWLNPKLPEVLKSLGFSDKVIARFKVNPENPVDSDLNVFLETRTKKTFLGWTISGQFDIAIDGDLADLKSTGTFSYNDKTKELEFIRQLSIYKWLNPEQVLDDEGEILFWFKNWQEYSANKADYPDHTLMGHKIPLMSTVEVEEFLRKKLTALDACMNKPSNELPLCTPEELWQKPSTYAYYSKPTLQKPSKVFSDPIEAQRHLQDKGVGNIQVRQSQPTKCLYCSGRPKCTQADGFIQAGILRIA